MTSGNWRVLYRGVYLFDSSGLPDNATISAATLSIYGEAKVDNITITPNVNIYSSAPASNTALEAGDFDSLGTTAYSTAISYSSFSDTGYNDFVLNASGRSAISKTSVSKFGARNANYDVAATPPTWAGEAASFFTIYASEQGVGYKPKLVVTYTAPVATFDALLLGGD